MKKQTPFGKLAERLNNCNSFDELEGAFCYGLTWRSVPGRKRGRNNLLWFHFPELLQMTIPDNFKEPITMFRLNSFEQTKTMRIIALLLAEELWLNKK